jgi:hypothetical protein
MRDMPHRLAVFGALFMFLLGLELLLPMRREGFFGESCIVFIPRPWSTIFIALILSGGATWLWVRLRFANSSHLINAETGQVPVRDSRCPAWRLGDYDGCFTLSLKTRSTSNRATIIPRVMNIRGKLKTRLRGKLLTRPNKRVPRT